MVFQAVAAVGSAIAGGYAANRAAQKNQANVNDAIRLEANLWNRSRASIEAGRTQYVGALSSIRGGFQAGRNALQTSRIARRSQVTQSIEPQAAGIASSMTSRGLYSTTAYDAARFGMTLGVQSALDQIDAYAAAADAELSAREGLAVGGAQQALGQFELGAFGIDNAITQSRVGILMGQQFQGGIDGKAIGALGATLDKEFNAPSIAELFK